MRTTLARHPRLTLFLVWVSLALVVSAGTAAADTTFTGGNFVTEISLSDVGNVTTNEAGSGSNGPTTKD
jgi:hypothetical protein